MVFNPGISVPVVRTISFQLLLLCHITIIEIMVGGESGMNPVGKAIIKCRTEIGRARDRINDLLFSSPVRCTDWATGNKICLRGT